MTLKQLMARDGLTELQALNQFRAQKDWALADGHKVTRTLVGNRVTAQTVSAVKPSYKYYSCDESLVPDRLFDMLCLQLLADGLPEGAWFTALHDKSALMAGTCYHIGDKLDATLVSIANFLRV